MLKFFNTSRLTISLLAPYLWLSLSIPQAHAEQLVLAIAPSASEPPPEFIEVPPDGEFKRFQRSEYVRQEVPSKIEHWQAITQELARLSGLELTLAPATSQLQFELQLAKGEFDLAFMSPLQFVSQPASNAYQALAKPKAKLLKGLVVVRQDSKVQNLRDLEGKTIVFPGALDFVSSIIPRHSLETFSIQVNQQYVASALDAYESVLSGSALAAAGSRETLLQLDPNKQNALKIIWDTPGFSPFVLAAKSGMPFFTSNRLQRALVRLIKTETGKEHLPKLFIPNGFEIARDSDWDDARHIDINQLNQ